MEFEILDSNGNVENVIVADLDYMHAFYSGRFREKQSDKLISKEGLLNRFTVEEWNTIKESTDPNVVYITSFIESNRVIDLYSTYTKDMMQALVNKNLLTIERKEVILSGNIDLIEML